MTGWLENAALGEDAGYLRIDEKGWKASPPSWQALFGKGLVNARGTVDAAREEALLHKAPSADSPATQATRSEP